MVPTLSKAFEIQRLRVLVEVAHRGSVSRAAEDLGLTQPTVSLHLKALNEALGVAVVERRGRGIRLTEAGRVLETHARRALAELERAQEALDERRDLATGSLRVGAGVCIGTYVIPRVVRGFQDLHPSIDFELEVGSSGAISTLLKRGELNIGVVGEIPPHPDLEFELLGTERLVGVVAADSPLAKKRRASSDALRKATLLARSNGSATQALVDRVLRRMKVEPARRWGFEGPEAMTRAACEGLGIAFLAERSVRTELDEGRLAEVELEGRKPLTVPIQLVRSVHHARSPAEHAFVELLEAQLSESGH